MTVVEIEEHLAAGKPALIYFFSAAPARPDSVSGEQYRALKAFKESCSQRGLIEEYDDLATFKEKVSRHLAQVVISRFAAGMPTA